jgi:hypothetical protein
MTAMYLNEKTYQFESTGVEIIERNSAAGYIVIKTTHLSQFGGTTPEV